ncbi:MAG: hypothetical protein L3J43_08435 [Sulfurovum sp.]|nr:hypothetical protein [Sulfurovum sp.]
MASSLDKLKALTNKLEEKLEKKDKKVEIPAADTKKVEKKEVEKPVKEVEKSAKKVETVKKSPVVRKKVSSTSTDSVRVENIERVKTLYEKLKIFEKSPDFDNIFIYKAMNLSGIGLKEDDFGEVREGKYIQIIAITYEPDKNGKKKAKNISLGYFGKAETLEGALKNEIIEFVLRWRYEKAFQNLEHYKDLIARVEVPADTLF